MTRAARHNGSLVKSAMLWLTIGVMLASVYGALLAVSSDQRPQILFAAPEPAPVLTASNGFPAENAER
jgi:hypothetical protein